MAIPENELNNLSEDQKLALKSYTSVTDQDFQQAIPLLRRSQWNVEIAIAKFFDGEGPDPVLEALASQNFPPPRTGRAENLQESLSFGNSWRSNSNSLPDPAPRIVPQADIDVIRRPPFIMAVFFAPFNILYRLVLSSYNFLIYFFSLSSLRSGSFSSHRQHLGRRPLKPRDSAARLKREFEEEYGNQSLPFFDGGYAQALDLAKSQYKFLIILLLSPEHDDTESFVRETLLDPKVQDYIQKRENNIIFWAGDVRDSEAYQVSAAVKCTKFPFTAVVAHSPNISSTSMSVIISITGAVDADTYLTKLRSTITKHEEQLAIARANRSAKDFERNLRQEQNSAYERSLARDKERARLKREVEAAAADAKNREIAQKEAAALLESKKLQWRQWRASRFNSEPDVNEDGVVRIALKMPEQFGASRILRKFRASDKMEEIYAFVECYEFLKDEKREEVSKPSDYDHQYQFLLVQSLPRVVYQADDEGSIGKNIGKTGNLIVELIIPEDQDSEEK
ncbi:UBX domain-containing protein 10 [Golovinomyces cichoracearum]|uniref:UBX domain-containing protein 10 n=1 Tax=Golovinomyces cichoracearum TaxID=62708 RepID=A0A420H7M9_9PEZI|nr:UBX domain-containing protein 10 [Golovinomyces cichoracearum]